MTLARLTVRTFRKKRHLIKINIYLISLVHGINNMIFLLAYTQYFLAKHLPLFVDYFYKVLSSSETQCYFEIVSRNNNNNWQTWMYPMPNVFPWFFFFNNYFLVWQLAVEIHFLRKTVVIFFIIALLHYHMNCMFQRGMNTRMGCSFIKYHKVLVPFMNVNSVWRFISGCVFFGAIIKSLNLNKLLA